MAANNSVNRGIEAKEHEIASLDTDASATSPPTGCSDVPVHPAPAASYVQVTVQKQRRARPLARAASCCAPAPASLHAPPRQPVLTGDDEAAACPALAVLASLYAAYGDATRAPPAPPGGGCAAARDETNNGILKLKQKSADKQEYSSSEDEAEAVRVLRLERAGDALAVATVRAGRTERAARRVRRRADRAVRAALAFPRLVFELPVALLLHVERCALETACGAAVGGVRVAADALGKPALAAVHNALAAAMAAAAASARALREALLPLAAALGDALDPLARLAASLRLVHVHVHRVRHLHCMHAHGHAPAAV